MTALLALLDGPVSQRLTWTLLHFLWQGIAIALVLAAVVRAFRVRRAAGRYLLCVAAMLAMVASPLVTFHVVSPSTRETASPEANGIETTQARTLLSEARPFAASTEAAPEFVGGNVTESSDQSPPTGRTVEQSVRMAQPVLLLLWVCGVGLLSLRSVLGLVGTFRLGRGKTPVSEGLVYVAAVLAKRLGLKRATGLFGSGRVREAVAMGFLRPMVLLPASWLTEMPADVLEAVIAHELAHVRRWDLWVNLFQRLAEILLFYHPAVWWLSRRIRLQREMCCDELAVAATGRRIAYASALHLAACRRLQAKKPAGAWAAAMGGSRMTTLDRVRYILGLSPTHEPMRWWPAGLLAMLVPLLVWFGLAGSPRPAQGDEQPADGASPATVGGTAGTSTGVRKQNDAISPAAAAQSTPTLGEIQQAWKTRQDRIRSARFEWTETQLIAKRTMPPVDYFKRLQGKLPPESKPGEWLPSDDLTVEDSRSVSVSGNMMRVTRQGEQWDVVRGKVLTTPYLAASDGKIAVAFYEGTDRTGRINPPIGFIEKIARIADWDNEELLPIMLAARPCDIDMGGRDLGRFRVSPRMETVAGHECVVLTPGGDWRDETLWLDLRRGFIVLRVVRPNGAGDVTCDISYREDSSHGWLPSGWKRVSAGWPTTERPTGRLIYQVAAKVTKREVNVDIPRSEFHFDFPAGTKVYDRRTEAGTKGTEDAPLQPAKRADNPKPAAATTKVTAAKPTAAAPEKESYTFPISLSGRATDLDGKPIPRAKVYIASIIPDTKRLAETTTDEQGRYELRNVPVLIARANTNRGRDCGAFEVFAHAVGYGFAWRPHKWFYPQPNSDTLAHGPDADLPVEYQVGDKIELDLKFPPPAKLRGRVVDDHGQPIAGTRLAIRYCDPIPPDGYPDERSFQTIRGERSFDSLNERAVVPPEIKIRQTDADGRFEFTGLPPDCRLRIDVAPPGFAGETIWAATCDEGRTGLTGRPIHAGEIKLTFVRPREVPVLVLYGDSRKPAPKVLVTVAGTTDSNGRATARQPPGDYKVELLPEIGTPYLVTDDKLQVSEVPPKEPIVYLLRPAAVVEVRVVDADTGQGVANVDLWREKTLDSPGSGPRYYREVHYFRSYEAATRICHVERPRTNADGVLRALFEPGKHRIGVGKDSYPNGYQVVEEDGKEIDAKAGEPVRLTFHVQKRR